MSGFSYFLLYTCLFKEEGHVAVVAEVADTLGADNAAGPFGSDIVVELMNVECRTAVVDKCANTVFFYLTSFVMVVMTFLVMMFAFMMMFIFVMVMRLFFLLFAYLLLYATNPSGGSCGTFKVKEVGMDNLIQVYICIVTLYNLGTGLQGVDNLPDTF